MLGIKGYDVQEKIATGHRSVIYRGLRLEDQRAVVVKTPAKQSPSAYDRHRCHHEYQIASRINQPNVVGYLDFLNLENRPIIVMEDGGKTSLRNVIPERGLNLITFFKLAEAAAKGLFAIHRAGVIHKAITPDNLIVSGETLKIGDFYIAVSTSLEKSRQLRNQDVIEGDFTYLSPEQTGRMNRDLDTRSDLYSLGVTYYEMLTGRPPFVYTDPLELIHCHVARVPNSPHEHNETIPKTLSALILKLLEKNAEDRYHCPSGVLADLVHCRNQYIRTGAVPSFQLGKQDVHSRFQIVQKLYGREREFEQMMTVFDRVDDGSCELVLISGAAGVGKSYLAHELRRPISGRRGHVISGKFTPYNQKAYAAITEAFRELVRQILSERDAQVMHWRDRLDQAIFPNGQLLVSLIPELSHLIGPHPTPPQLDLQPAQTRFNLVFRKFVTTFAEPDHPLVLFLDDLQWCDQASMQLIEELLNRRELANLMIVGSYREPLPDDHDLHLMIERLHTMGATITHLQLEAISRDAVEHMLTDTLETEREKVAPLAERIMRKTAGNPFFIHELLEDFYRHGLLVFDAVLRRWTWDLDQIGAAKVSDDVVDFMIARLDLLPINTRNLLNVAACIGARFPEDVVGHLIDLNETQIQEALSPALSEGLLFAIWDREKQVEPIAYEFAHDRLRDAAYRQIDEQQRRRIHYHYGLIRLEEPRSADTSPEELLHHLNQGVNFIWDPNLRKRLLDLNYRAAKMTNASAASAKALEYLKVCVRLLPDEYWRDAYQETFDIIREYAQTAYLCGDSEIAERNIQLLLDKAKNNTDKASVWVMRAEHNIAVGKYRLAYQALVQGLALCDIHLPNGPIHITTFIERLKLKRLLAKKPLDHFLQRKPPLAEPRIALQLLNSLHVVLYTFGEKQPSSWVMLKRINTALEAGPCVEAGLNLITYGHLICRRGQLREGMSFAEVGLDVFNQRQGPRYLCRARLVYGFVTHWNRHAREAVAAYQDAFQAGLQHGDMVYLSSAADGITYWDPDLHLRQAYDLCQTHLDLFLDVKYRQLEQNLVIHQQMRANLLGETENRLSLDSAAFKTKETQNRLRANSHYPGLAVLSLTKLRILVIYEAFDEALALFMDMDELAEAIHGQMYEIDYTVYGYLAIAGAHQSVPSDRFLKRLRHLHQKVRRWAEQAPVNFTHFEYLMDAELARLQEQPLRAMSAYDQAAATAAHHQYPVQEALILDRAACFCRRRGMDRHAAAYAAESRTLYVNWGAKRKVEHIDQLYGHLLATKPKVRQTHKPAAETKRPKRLERDPTGSPRSIKDLDLATVTKASQAIASEIDIDKFLERVMRIIIESVGAQQGLLIFDEKDGPRVQAAIDDVRNHVEVRQEHTLDDEHRYPGAVIRFVMRTEETLVLRHPHQEGAFTKTPYIQYKRPKAVLCTPIHHKDRPIGALYLENNLSAEAFSHDRIQVLAMLLAQTAISFDNARFFEEAREHAAKAQRLNEDLEQRVADRTRQLELTQQDLLERAHRVGMAGIANTILHNIGNILTSVITSSRQISQVSQQSRAKRLGSANTMLNKRQPAAGAFLKEDPKGRQLLEYYLGLGQVAEEERDELMIESHRLLDKVTAIKDVILSQQSYAAKGFQTELTQLETVIEDVLTMQQNALRRAEVEIVRSYQPTPPVMVQRVKLIHIIINLIKNAIEAMRHSHHRTLTIGLNRQGDTIDLAVQDTGSGIDADSLEKIFNYGFTTKDSGHGFGLHGSANAMTEMNGRISVSSDGPQRGATFTLHFPLVQQKDTAKIGNSVSHQN